MCGLLTEGKNCARMEKKEAKTVKTVWLPSRRGDRIPCHDNWEGQSRVVIVCHGFGSSKESPMVQALHRALPERGIGVWSFDFPAHGDSPMGQEGLRVPFCMDDLETVEAWIRAKSPQVEVCYFASSFGAYITLLSLSRAPRNRPRAFLRSAAVTMPQLVARWLTPRAKKDLERRGYFVPDYAYVREMRITPAFLRDLWEYDLFSRYTPELASLFMVHGALDEVVAVKDARRFAETFGAQLRIFPQGEHPLMGNGELEAVLAWAADFFLGKE